MYFPEIDGIRFLAIILVILFHAHGYFLAKTPIDINGHSPSWFDDLLSKGDRGVELFFVLSGFILCMPFAHHYINKGKPVKLKKYYLRRVTRLEPPYILAITGIFLLQVMMHANGSMSVAEQLKHYFASLTYTHGIIFHTVPIITVVAWSLEIEIQFYLLAPLLFRVLLLPPAARRIIITCAIIAIVLLQHAYMPTVLYLSIYRLIQYFLIGIFLADLYVSDALKDIMNSKIMVVVFAILLPVICMMPLKGVLYAELAFPFLIGMMYLIVMKNEAVKKVFSFKFIPVIGGMCYSIYLIHYTVISIVGRFTKNITITQEYLPNLLLQLVLLTVAALAVSSVYYLLVERPFMDQKWTNKLMKKDIRHEEMNTQA